MNDRSYSDVLERVDRFVGDSAHERQASMIVFAGSANPSLAREIVGHLNMPLGKAIVDRFSDGEVMVELIDSVRGKDAFVGPADVHLVRPRPAPIGRREPDGAAHPHRCPQARIGGTRVTAVVPYYGYARQDRRPRSARVSISAKVVAET